MGAATAAHQVEGNNTNSDCWVLENLPHSGYSEPSLDAVDHYNRYEEDIKYMAEAGLNAYRFSIEWARIEPERGAFDEKEIEHYRRVLQCCKKNGLTPIVTMMHFSSPKWLIEDGGWNNPDVIDYFASYCKYVIAQLGEDLEYICTINEANMRMQEEERAAFGGVDEVATFLSGCTDEQDRIICKAHAAAREAMKSVKPDLKVGLTLSVHDIQAVEGGEEKAAGLWEEEFVHYLPYIREDDFFGLQNYTRMLVGPNGELPVPEGNKLTQMDYEFYPQALEHVIRTVAKDLSIPILVTENGVATDHDDDRIEFIRTALAGVKACKRDGISVIGYMYWSLLDNFEWQMGYGKTFGLIQVDRKTQKRMPKQSLSEIRKSF